MNVSGVIFSPLEKEKKERNKEAQKKKITPDLRLVEIPTKLQV